MQEVTLDLYIPYLVGGTGQISVASSTIGCFLQFKSVRSAGKSFRLTFSIFYADSSNLLHMIPIVNLVLTHRYLVVLG